MKPPNRPKYSSEALEWMRFKRQDGMRISDIANRLGVSTPRAQQLCEKAKVEHEKRMRSEVHLLPLLKAIDKETSIALTFAPAPQVRPEIP